MSSNIAVFVDMSNIIEMVNSIKSSLIYSKPFDKSFL